MWKYHTSALIVFKCHRHIKAKKNICREMNQDKIVAVVVIATLWFDLICPSCCSMIERQMENSIFCVVHVCMWTRGWRSGLAHVRTYVPVRTLGSISFLSLDQTKESGYKESWCAYRSMHGYSTWTQIEMFHLRESTLSLFCGRRTLYRSPS